MSNVFDDIYADAFKNELVKIAQNNNIDPDKLIQHVMEKHANRVGDVTGKIMTFAKGQLNATGNSFKNMVEAGSGLGSGVSHKVQEAAFNVGHKAERDVEHWGKSQEGFNKMKAALPKAKRALALSALGVGGAGAGTYALTR